MPRITHLAGALALALAGASVAQAQEFTGVINFGDSLTDGGQYAGLVPGAQGSFTTNPDPVWAEIVSARFGFTSTPSRLGGSNYAWGGAPTSAPFVCVPVSLPCRNLQQQLSDYLTPRGGRADPNALYGVWIGANNIFNAAANPATAQATTITSANIAVSLISSLQTAGAHYIVVMNLPDIGLTPQFRGTGSQASISALSYFYNDTLNAGLASLGDGIIPINTFGLINEVMANPGRYGFTNITNPACAVPSSLVCTTGTMVAPGANQTYLFADGVHPSGAAHAMLANVVIATITAPGQVSLAGEVPLQVYDDHVGVINNRIFGLRGGDRPEGDVNGYANLQFGDQSYEMGRFSPGMDSNLATLTGGVDYNKSDSLRVGAAVSLGVSNGDTGLGGVDGTEFLASGYGVVGLGKGYLDVILSAGSNNLDISRQIPMGPSLRTEEGNTHATHLGLEIGGGYDFGSGAMHHGPFASVAWQKIDVKGYSEESADSTAMWFRDFNRESLVGRLGYQFETTSDSKWRPYGRIAYAVETQDDAAHVQAGSQTMNGHFTISGYEPSDSWIEADLGLTIDISDKTQASFGYRGHFNDDNMDRNSLNFGLRMSF
ncbi:autotransporter domain-containing protein [Arenimonas oryziterrae]|uniref:Autotransporter domain-containing protein n=1 Tax=Arenimonas oryziterrae DSM 21050 = YC6267 TaxID=1121015 RepID=A0A091BHM4_9GAMM|nr:autotransporter domain-containing protein [Arenimonas oryziterrae]KFN43855.1 hypothetical protein N789_07870 [Arenimonas oryziterrae DSM 21050 = YC6267]